MNINWENVEFKNGKRFLSNMFPVEIKMDKDLESTYPMFVFDELTYPATENLYQVLKTSDLSVREEFSKCHPLKSKTLGQTEVVVREDWDDIKIEAMKLCTELKYRNSDMAILLQATGDYHLEERNDWNDQFWGTYLGMGENNLGKILMEKRTKLNQGDL